MIEISIFFVLLSVIIFLLVKKIISIYNKSHEIDNLLGSNTPEYLSFIYKELPIKEIELYENLKKKVGADWSKMKANQLPQNIREMLVKSLACRGVKSIALLAEYEENRSAIRNSFKTRLLDEAVFKDFLIFEKSIVEEFEYLSAEGEHLGFEIVKYCVMTYHAEKRRRQEELNKEEQLREEAERKKEEDNQRKIAATSLIAQEEKEKKGETARKRTASKKGGS